MALAASSRCRHAVPRSETKQTDVDMFIVRVLLTLQLVGWSASQAPGDAQTFCTVDLAIQHPVYPNNIRVLMDSADYLSLIRPDTDPPPVWQTVDVDGIDSNTTRVSWEETRSFGCSHQMEVCGFTVPDQDNWLITQHINRTLPNGFKLEQVSVIVEFSFNGCTGSECSASFSVYKYDTSVIDPAAARTVSNYGSVPVERVVPLGQSGQMRQNHTFEIDFEASDQETGFYLATRDENSCISIFRVLVFYYVCPEEARERVQFQELLAPPVDDPPIVVSAECISRGSPESGTGEVRVTCNERGVWLVILGCECDPGYQSNENGTICLGCPAGQFTDGMQCLDCPSNTNTSVAHVNECQCLPGYYRAPNEGPEVQCTLICCSEWLSECMIALSITVLPVIPADSIQFSGNILSWAEPDSPSGVILYYEILFRESVITRATPGGELLIVQVNADRRKYDVSHSGLLGGQYFVQIRAATESGPGSYSDPVPITLNIANGSAITAIVAPIATAIMVTIIGIAILLVYIKRKRLSTPSTHDVYVDMGEYHKPRLPSEHCNAAYQNRVAVDSPEDKCGDPIYSSIDSDLYQPPRWAANVDYQSKSTMNAQASAKDKCGDAVYYYSSIDPEPHPPPRQTADTTYQRKSVMNTQESAGDEFEDSIYIYSSIDSEPHPLPRQTADAAYQRKPAMNVQASAEDEFEDSIYIYSSVDPEPHQPAGVPTPPNAAYDPVIQSSESESDMKMESNASYGPVTQWSEY